MDQTKFIWLTKNTCSYPVTQGGNGVVSVDIASCVNISHNYKKKNQMIITFKDDQAKYVLPSDKDLEEIYKIYATHTNPGVVMRKYCEVHCEKV